MRARTILSKNLRALIDDAKETKPNLGAIRKVAEASGGKLTNGTVGRIAAGSHTTDIDALASLAEVFKLQPWQLLVENLNPKALPHLADAALLSQIKQIVDSVPATTGQFAPSPTDELPLQRQDRFRGVTPGSTLDEVTNREGVNKNAGRTAAKGAKHAGRRRG